LIPWTSCAPFHQVVHLTARGGRRLDALREGGPVVLDDGRPDGEKGRGAGEAVVTGKVPERKRTATLAVVLCWARCRCRKPPWRRGWPG
jgi:hypothetical protein